MKLKQNGMLKILVPGVLAVAAIIGIKAFTKSSQSNESSVENYTINDLKPEELRALGIDGDTPHDTVRTLIGTVKATRQDIAEIKTQNADLARRNKELQRQATDVDSKVAEVISRERQNMSVEFENAFQHRTDSLVSELERRIAELSNLVESPSSTIATAKQGSDMPIGLGLEGESLPNSNSSPNSGMRWVMPSDMQEVDHKGNPISSGQKADSVRFPNPFSALDDSTIGKAHEDFTGKSTREAEAIPVYTLPENSTLVGSISMTALLGRVPLNGVVNDPYPFKILIGRENLTANGIDLPEVEGAIISGTATGDWTLSCVRGTVNSMTLVFNDGRVRTLPNDRRSGNNGSKNSSESSIGWLSDPHGIPCIAGARKTNAPEFLATSFLLGGASAAAQAWSQSQTTTVVNGDSVVGAVTGDQGKYLAGQALGAGLAETTDWVRQRYGQTFDAIYVPPGQTVAVHITQELAIDYEPDGRKVKYATYQTQGAMD
ncbi:TIGR03752 family integrating conjugative element protein [Testudinibacter sp. P80/BLE/0925]|uniref:TIGR03752 family integrating conjugative element protein n=1 Tax=Testudinibacter sp. TW-1 TaxID=3417757 RepID=UPI003D360993